MSPEEKDKIKKIFSCRETRIEACRKSLMLFSIYYFSHYHLRPMADFHRKWYSDLSFSELTGVALIAFRESVKTTIAKMKILHAVCYGYKRFCVWTSYDESKAEANLYDIALELQTNQALIADFGQLFFEEKMEEKFTRKKSIGEFITANKIKVKAYSTGKSPRGEVYREFRPDLIVLDDIETMKTVDSEAMTSQVEGYIDELLAGLSGDANVILLGNRLAEGGSIDYFLRKIEGDPKWKIYDIPAVYPDGRIAWPEKYCLTDAEAERENAGISDPKRRKVSLESKERLLGPSAYNREMLNCPILDSEREFSKKWFLPISRAEVDRKETRNYLTIDTAVSEKSSADNTGICINFVDRENKWNLIAYKVRMPPDELLAHIFYLADSIKFEKIGIEKTVYYDVFKIMLDGEMRKRNKFLPIYELKHNSASKQSRIRGLIHRYSSKSIFHIAANDLEDELYSFPKCLHDDVADSAAYQLQLAQPPGQQREYGKPERNYNQFFRK